MMGIYRLIYRSRAVLPVTQDTISAIVEKSVPNNERLGITGLLLATQTHFFQVLEGSHEAVNEVYHKIARDPRHTNLTLISYSPVPARTFRDWSMRGLELGLLGRMLGRQLREKYGEEDGQLVLPQSEEMAFAFLFDVLIYLRRGPVREEP
jgi:hypothetical protein